MSAKNHKATHGHVYLLARRPDNGKAFCSRCKAKTDAARRRERMATDPAFHARRNEVALASYHRRKKHLTRVPSGCKLPNMQTETATSALFPVNHPHRCTQEYCPQAVALMTASTRYARKGGAA